MKKISTLILAVLLVISFAATSFAAGATDFPKKEITIIVPWNAGGTNDMMARGLQPIFMEMFGVNLVVQNSPGGGSAVGITEAMTARPDGYTLGLASSSFLALVAQGNVGANLDALTNIALVAEEPIILVAKANNGKFANGAEMIELAKQAPESISIGIPGSNNVNQAYATLLGRAASTEFLFVPFDGGSRVVSELIGGNIDCGALKPSEVLAQIQAGELIPLCVFNEDGLSLLPEVPTANELGYDVFTLGKIRHIGYLMAAPGVDPAIVEKLADMFKQAMESEAFQNYANELGFVSQPIVGDELDAYIAEVYSGLTKASEEIFMK